MITAGWGFGVFAGVAVALSVFLEGGAHINPAVTIGLATIGSTPWSDVPVYIAGQFVGAFVGAVLVWLAYSNHWGATEDPGLKLACYSTGPAIRNPVANLITEIIGTFALLFGMLALGGVSGAAAAIGPLAVASSCGASASRWAVPPGTPSTRPATWAHASPTPSFRSPARAARTGATAGSLWSDQSSAASWAR